jgi:hypothetical protein
MVGPLKPIGFTASAEVSSESDNNVIYALSLAAGSGAAGRLQLLEGGSGGTVVWELAAVTGGGDSINFGPGGIAVNNAYITLSGAGAVGSASIGS